MKADNITKKFDKKIALEDFSIHIKKGSIYGLVGTNGGGKTTFLNLASGVYSQDLGELSLNGENIKGNLNAKEKIFYLPDEAYYFHNFSVNQMANFYKGIYHKTWNEELYKKLTQRFPIEPKLKFKSFSKGMKKQAMIILALACQPEILLIDEAFDGLDAVIRMAVRKIISDIVFERKMTVIIASHNLRELEDFCDTIGLIHSGKLILEQGLDTIFCDYCKAKLAFKSLPDLKEIEKTVLSIKYSGNFVDVSAKLKMDEMEDLVSKFKPDFMQIIPLSLEEVFISEMEAIGYDYNQIIL